VVQTVAAILLWFVLNISIANVTKWTYVHGVVCGHDIVECSKYNFPLAVTVVHMLFCWLMCFVFLRYKGANIARPVLGVSKQVVSVVPLAGCVALSVGCGNLALQYIYPSFNQMLGSTTPLITVIMATACEGKRYNSWTWFSLVFICGGLVICSVEEVNFHILGFLASILATVLRAAKSIIQGQLLHASEMFDAVTLLYYMAPWAAALLMVLSLCVEGMKPITILLYGYASDFEGTRHVLSLLILGGLNACLLNILNFQVTAYTSAVTLNVLGNVKNCIGIGISVLIFRNRFRLEQAVGVAICLLGVSIYQKFGCVVQEKQLETGEATSLKAGIAV